MEVLLRSSERRRLRIAEYLFNKDGYVTLSELADVLGSSERILKYDFVEFKNTFKDFQIQTSHYGVTLVSKNNKGLKTLYNNILSTSTSFQLLELIFFEEDLTVTDLAEKLFVSPSTLYRMISKINKRADQFGFQIQTNPCKLIGSEEMIRSFYYIYFYEKYSNLDWPYKNDEFVALDHLLLFITELYHQNIDFAYYYIFKLITLVNYYRYKNNNYIEDNGYKVTLDHVFPDEHSYNEATHYFEESLRLKLTDDLVFQLFSPYARKDYFLSFEELIESTKSDADLYKEVHFLDEMMTSLSEDNQIPIPNKEEIILGLHNSAKTGNFDPRSGYVLYDRNKHFVDTIKNDFPVFYQQTYQGILEYKKLIGIPISENGLNYLIYIIFAHWHKLIIELRKKIFKTRILIISNRNVSHSLMLKDFLEYELTNHLDIHIYSDIIVSKEILEGLDYDLIIANFPLPDLQSKTSICIENVPTYTDIYKIQREINDITLKYLETQAVEASYNQSMQKL